MDYVLAKIGKRQRMQALVETGAVYMQQLTAYWTLESKVVGDRNEGLHSRYSADNPTLVVKARIGEREIELPGASISLASPTRHHGVYCMCAIPVPGDGTLHSDLLMPIVRDAKMAEFGDTLVLFRDTKEFVRRLEVAASDLGFDLDARPIEYVGEDHCGEMGPFRKLDSYRYQSEWRFLTTTPIVQAQTLQLGSLLDIANWIDLNEAHADLFSAG